MLSEGNLKIVKKLLEKGATIKAQNNKKDTPLQKYFYCLTSSKKHTHTIEILREFLRAGANLNVLNNNYNAVHYAAASSYPETLRFILETGVDPNKENEFHYTPLKSAINSIGLTDASENIKILIQHGAKFNEADQHGYTPLMNAVTHNKLTAAQALIACKANVNMITHMETALHMAVKQWDNKMVSLLLAAGADYNAKSNTFMTESKTPLQIAQESLDGNAKARFILDFKKNQKLAFLCSYHPHSGKDSTPQKLGLPKDVTRQILKYDF